jgi:hypothetical protein
MERVPDCPHWEVWRQDDNGNRYLVSTHTDKASAELRLAELESGVVHKQAYWITEGA